MSSTTTTDPSRQELGHVMSKRVLIAVWAALVVLTVVTVAVTRVEQLDFGRFNIWLALIIATVKGSLVGLYFMHLRYDSPLHALILIIALAFVAMFIIGTITDTAAYQEILDTPRGWPISP
jgi:cytochrome c oxidase subunit IV